MVVSEKNLMVVCLQTREKLDAIYSLQYKAWSVRLGIYNMGHSHAFNYFSNVAYCSFVISSDLTPVPCSRSVANCMKAGGPHNTVRRLSLLKVLYCADC